MREPHSLLNFYKKVICLRNELPALYQGSLRIAHDLCTKKIFAYYRIFNDEKYMVILNMSNSRVTNPAANVEVLLSTHLRSETYQLQPFEGQVVMLRTPE